MSPRLLAIAGAALAAIAAGGYWYTHRPHPAAPPAPSPGLVAPRGPEISDVGPRIVSNQTRYPIMIYGRGFLPESKVRLLGQTPIAIEATWIDDRHLSAVVPEGLTVTPGRSSEQVEVTVIGPDGSASAGKVFLTVVNDAELVVPAALEVSGDDRRLFVVSETTDDLWIIERTSGVKRRPRICDGPRDLARYQPKGGEEQLLVACGFGRELVSIPTARPDAEPRRIPLGFDARGVAIDPSSSGLAWVTSAERDEVVAVALDRGAPIEGRSFAAGVNPGPVAVASGFVLAGNDGTEDLSVFSSAGTSTRAPAIRPGPGTPIIGGSTEPFSDLVMGGKAVRAIVGSSSLGVAFASSIGPNIGPNPKRMEVTMNGGVSVVDPERGRFIRHVSMLGGVTEGLALDDNKHLLYVADFSQGRVVVLDASRLAGSDESARSSVLGSLEIAPPENTPLIRPASDFSTNGRAGISIHTGPRSLRLDSTGSTLFVLNRFTREVVEIDVERAAKGSLGIVRRHPGLERAGPKQVRRMLGEVVYFTDLGKSGMTCDACHPSGNTGGVMYTKSKPIRIYRSPPIRGAVHSAPFFTPSRLPSIRATAHHVLARNRYQNPAPTPEEISALTEYTEAIAPVPNPFRGPKGELPSSLPLPSSRRTGDAVAGLRIFEGKGGCASRCHPPPHFTSDQDARTRGQLLHVGTPTQLPLRLSMQDTQDYGQPPPSLVGVWDVFPLFGSGAAGLTVDEAKGTVEPTHPFALGRVLEYPYAGGSDPHGKLSGLTEREKDDLLAYLLTL